MLMWAVVIMVAVDDGGKWWPWKIPGATGYRTLFAGTLLNPRTRSLVASVGDADDCPPPSSAAEAAAATAATGGAGGGVQWRRSISAAYLVDLSRTFLTSGRTRWCHPLPLVSSFDTIHVSTPLSTLNPKP
jgi:hypothetical protein